MRVHLISNGRFGTLLTETGGGFSAFEGRALTRWAPDPTLDAEGVHIYLRDVDGGRFWTVGLQPAGHGAVRYDARFGPALAEFEREDGELHVRMEVGVAAEQNAELRRIRITNRGERPRRLELTTYAELVLNAPAGDASHPAFSKLFVQTGFLPENGALVAWRRQRSPEEAPLWAVHRLILPRGAAPVGHETDRARFLGRGRGPEAPAALSGNASLSGSVGNVLDPAFSLRGVLDVAPGERVECTALLGAGRSRGDVQALLERLDSPAAVEAALRATRPASADGAAVLGLPDAWLDGLGAGMEEAGEPGTADHATAPAAPAAAVRKAGVAQAPASAAPDSPEPLRLFNGLGGFSADGSEYVVRVEPAPDGLRLPPLPWTNVVANEQVGCLVSERGAGYTWAANSRENRLTPWSNDPVSDPHGEALYLRDEEEGVFWSPTPGPVPGVDGYEVRHGFGYTRFLHGGRGLEQEVVVFVPREDPVKIMRVRVANRSGRPRRLSLFRYAHLVLGVHPADTRGRISTELDPATGAVLAQNPKRGEFSSRVAFAGVVDGGPGAALSRTTDRAAFLGRDGSVSRPAALAADAPLSGVTGTPVDPCVAERLTVDLAPGAVVECAFLLGEEADAAAARACLERYRDLAAVDRVLDEVRAFWRELLSAVRIETPAPALDLMVNGWLAYQNIACRMWGRSAFYQSGGAFGYRDQLQDSSALLYLDPAMMRRQILLHAGHQFVEGDVLHWWHPPADKGMRTRFSDDLLWLPYITSFYVQSTGDVAVFDEEASFLCARGLEPGEDEAYVVPEDAGERGSVYEHCCRALDRSLTRGAHGLPLMGVGDWNDGMNRVGREGRGESVWLGFFLYQILEGFIPFCDARGDAARAERYRDYRRHLAKALNDAGWDGAWYRRAYYDNGAPLGSAESDECRIDTIAQAWAVLSGAASPERADLALDAMEERLVSEAERIIRLLTPAFDRTPHDPGYIKGYLPGVRENGGQYTHAALWAVRALAEAGRSERAALLLEMLSPANHARTPEEVAVYQVEPYVIAADIYGVAPHVGRGGWTWYTGSAGWMFRVALESVLGLELRGGRQIALRPCIPAAWPGFRLRYRLPDGTVYAFEVTRGEAGAVTRATLDGEPVRVGDGAVVVPLTGDGAEHAVRVALGADVGPRYTPRPPEAGYAESSAAPLVRTTSA